MQEEIPESQIPKSTCSAVRKNYPVVRSFWFASFMAVPRSQMPGLRPTPTDDEDTPLQSDKAVVRRAMLCNGQMMLMT